MILALGAALTTAGCMTVADAPMAIEQDSISYEAGPCFGACPMYRVTVTPDGQGVFEGRNFTAVRGERNFQITPAQYRAFAAQLAPLRPEQGEVRLSSGSAGCDSYITDQASAKVTWTRQIGDSQAYYLDFGCRSAANSAARERLGTAALLLPIRDYIGPGR